MSFFNRVIKNIRRQYWRSILIVTILSIIAVVSIVSYSISSSAIANIQHIQKTLGNKLTLSLKRQSDNSKPTPVITEDIINKLNNSDYVENIDYEVSDWAQALVPSLLNKPIISNGMMKPGEKESKTKNKDDNIYMFGNLKPETLEDFTSKNVKISEGRFYNDDDINNKNAVVVISESLADSNNLNVNDHFKIKYHNVEFDVQIIGIYQQVKDTEDIRANGYPYLLAPATFLEYIAMQANKPDSIQIEKASFFLKDPLKREEFINEAFSLVDENDFELGDKNNIYQQLINPFKNMEFFSSIIRKSIIVAGILIMFFILFIITKERKCEIGTLRALGMKKNSIIKQLLCETLLLTTLALCIGGVLGVTVSASIASSVTNKGIVQSDEENKGMINGLDVSSELNNKVDIPSQNVEDLLSVIGIMVIITAIGSLSSVYIITKSEPMDILEKEK